MRIPNQSGEPRAVDATTTWYVDECCTLPGPDIRDLVEAVIAYGSTTVWCLQVRQQGPEVFTGREFTGRGEGSAPDA